VELAQAAAAILAVLPVTLRATARTPGWVAALALPAVAMEASVEDMAVHPDPLRAISVVDQTISLVIARLRL